MPLKTRDRDPETDLALDPNLAPDDESTGGDARQKRKQRNKAKQHEQDLLSELEELDLGSVDLSSLDLDSLGPTQSCPCIDMYALAEAVYRLMQRDLRYERERLGRR